MKKKLIALLMASVMVVSLTGMMAQAEEEETEAQEQEDVIAYFAGLMQGGAAWGQAEKGFLQACDELGWEGYYIAPTSPNDLTEMMTLIETAITNGANVLMGAFVDPDVFGDVLREAYANGVTIAGANAYVSDDCMDFWIGTDPTGMGTTQAETLADLVGDDECTVIYMQTNSTATTQNEQFAAFSDYLDDYDNITVWGQEYCDSNEVTAAETISNLVKANPEINAVVCADGNGCIGAANYVDESGNADSFYVVGIDDSADILNYVTSGALDCTIAQDFYAMGYEGCYMVQDLMNGEDIPVDNDSGTIIVTIDDVESYAEDKGIDLE